jgi:hypothetical protein
MLHNYTAWNAANGQVFLVRVEQYSNTAADSVPFCSFSCHNEATVSNC